jgi:hypothetical protein
MRCPMAYQNISAEIKPDDKNEIIGFIQQITNKLPFLINLTEEERKQIPKMGDKSIAFVEKALELAQQNPNLVPPFLNVEELKRDLNLAKDLRDLLNYINSLVEKLSDTYLAAGSEAFVAALSFYNSAKAAAKSNVPGTDFIVDELGKRFVKKTNAKTEPPANQ